MIPCTTLQNPGSALTVDNFTQHDLLPSGLCDRTPEQLSVTSRCALSCRKSVESRYGGALKRKMKGYPETPSC